MAKIFVGIPTLNRPDMVQETIWSLLHQTRCDWRAVVSDNVSEGDASARVETFVRGLADDRISFHQQPVNGGEYGQGRYFFEQAQRGGEDFMVIVHDDDLIEPTFLEAAVSALERNREAAFFVCNPTVISAVGQPRPEWSRDFDRRWGREGVAEGFIDVLDTHMRSGFTPISCAFFRTSALIASGFVDQDLSGCFPFESNVFLRLGERGMQAWFSPDRLFRLRWHSQQMINWGFLNSETIVEATIRLFERRQFTAENERRRRQTLGRLHRVDALHRASAGDKAGARTAARAAIRANPQSVRTWLVAGASILSPGLAGAVVRSWFGPRTFSSV
jgi:cellulose synthase/poly-beta-1,6-N-acetylglucosamine synthase-like glycosyltransferase